MRRLRGETPKTERKEEKERERKEERERGEGNEMDERRAVRRPSHPLLRSMLAQCVERGHCADDAADAAGHSRAK